MSQCTLRDLLDEGDLLTPRFENAHSLFATVGIILTYFVFSLIGVPVGLFLGRKPLLVVLRQYASFCKRCLTSTGTVYLVEGHYQLQNGPGLLICGHQSWFDTVVGHLLVPWPAYVMKSSINRIPVFRWTARLAGNITIDRENLRPTEWKNVLHWASKVWTDAGTVVWFATGTRLPYAKTVTAEDIKPGTVKMVLRALKEDVPVYVAYFETGYAAGRDVFDDKQEGVLSIKISRLNTQVNPTKEQIVSAIVAGVNRPRFC